MIGAVCLTTGWLLASMLTPPVALVQTLPQRQPPPPRENAAPFTEQLRLRLNDVPDPPTPRRNPFLFGAQERNAPRTAAPVAAPPPVVEPAPATPAGPSFELSGIGVTGDVRSAVLSDGRSVVLAKVGDVVGGFRVSEITDSTATLLSDAGTKYVLRLR